MSVSNVANSFSGSEMLVKQPSGVFYLSTPQTGVAGGVTTLTDFDTSFSYSGNVGDYFDLSSTGLLICKQAGVYDFAGQIIYNSGSFASSGVFKRMILSKSGQNFYVKTNQADVPDPNPVGVNGNTWTNLAVGDQVGMSFFQGATAGSGSFEPSTAPSGFAGSCLWWTKID